MSNDNFSVDNNNNNNNNNNMLIIIILVFDSISSRMTILSICSYLRTELKTLSIMSLLQKVMMNGYIWLIETNFSCWPLLFKYGALSPTQRH